MATSTVLRVVPGRPLRGTVRVPGDKSISHRAILLAAMARGGSRVENLLIAGVTRPMLQALPMLGVSARLQGSTLQVESPGFRAWRAPARVIHCGHSATTMRLMAGALAAAGVPAVLDGSEGLRRRPMRRVVAPLQAMGVPIRDTQGHAPLFLEARDPARPLRGGAFRLPVASAQVKSAILLAGLAASEPVEVIEPGPSRDHTERMLRSLGVHVEPLAVGHIRMTPPTGPLPGFALRVPGDISAAAFLIVAAVVTPGSEVRIEHVNLNPTRTGLLDALQAMHADIEVEVTGEEGGEPVGRIRVRHSPALQGIRVRGPLVVRMIDEFPVFAVAALHARGTTVVAEAEELRHKESDRIARLVEALHRLGVVVEERPDGFVLSGPQQVQAGRVHAHGDHRLAMAMAVAGLTATGPVEVLDGGIYAESFPTFPWVLQTLGARVEEQV